VPRQSRVGAKAPGRAPAYVMVAILIASPALAQGVDVTASLDITDGWARVGAYVPVTFEVTNQTDKHVVGVYITTGGPVDMHSQQLFAAAAKCPLILPVYYTGADLTLTVEFLDRYGREVDRKRVVLSGVRPLPKETGLLCLAATHELVPIDPREPEPALMKQLCKALRRQSLRVLRRPEPDLCEMVMAGMLDAAVLAKPDAYGRLDWPIVLLYLEEPDARISAVRFPQGIREIVQPRTFRLLRRESWSAADFWRLWLGLVLLVLAVLASAVLTLRHRTFGRASTMALLSVTAVAILLFLGGLRDTRLREARVFYAQPASDDFGVEHLAMLESRGRAVAEYSPVSHMLPVLVLDSSEDLFRPYAVLYRERGHDARGWDYSLRTSRPRVVVHSFSWQRAAFGTGGHDPSQAALGNLSGRADLIKGLLVEGSRATDAAGQSQTLDAWAVEWQGSDDPNVAYAGRSLKWWDSDRREGDGPFLLAWFHDPAENVPKEVDEYERLPALVVYSESPKAATRE